MTCRSGRLRRARFCPFQIHLLPESTRDNFRDHLIVCRWRETQCKVAPVRQQSQNGFAVQLEERPCFVEQSQLTPACFGHLIAQQEILLSSDWVVASLLRDDRCITGTLAAGSYLCKDANTSNVVDDSSWQALARNLETLQRKRGYCAGHLFWLVSHVTRLHIVAGQISRFKRRSPPSFSLQVVYELFQHQFLLVVEKLQPVKSLFIVVVFGRGSSQIVESQTFRIKCLMYGLLFSLVGSCQCSNRSCSAPSPSGRQLRASFCICAQIHSSGLEPTHMQSMSCLPATRPST